MPAMHFGPLLHIHVDLNFILLLQRIFLSDLLQFNEC